MTDHKTNVLNEDTNDLSNQTKYAQVRKELKEMLISEMVKADEKKPIILPAIIKRNK